MIGINFSPNSFKTLKSNSLLIQNRLLKATLNLTDSGLIIANTKHKIVFVNSVCKKIFKLPSQSIMGKQLEDVLQQNLDTLREYRTIKQKISLKNRAENHSVHFLVCKIVVNEKAAEGPKLLTELGLICAKLSHDAKNPLCGIKGFASLLQQDLQNQPKLYDMAKTIEKGADNLNQLLTSVLRYSQLHEPNLKATDLIDLIKSSIAVAQIDENWKDAVKIDFNCQNEPLKIKIDAKLFELAVVNLLKNGEQAIDKTGVVKISIHKSARSVTVSVSDDGGGIDKKDFKEIFRPFFSTKKKAIGLGLTEVEKIIKAHGGSIEFSSKLGQGSCFSVTIPISHDR